MSHPSSQALPTLPMLAEICQDQPVLKVDNTPAVRARQEGNPCRYLFENKLLLRRCVPPGQLNILMELLARLPSAEEGQSSLQYASVRLAQVPCTPNTNVFCCFSSDR